MPFALEKLPTKTVLIIAGLIALCIFSVLMLSIMSYVSDQPLVVWDKAFGFGSRELAKRTKELASCTASSASASSDHQRKLLAVETANAELVKRNAMLEAKDSARVQHDASLWFPVDDISFKADGTFTSAVSKRDGRGKWSSADSELTLRLLTMNDSEIFLETNLVAPGNRIRLSGQEGVLVPMARFEYSLAVHSMAGEEVQVRVSRRPKAGI